MKPGPTETIGRAKAVVPGAVGERPRPRRQDRDVFCFQPRPVGPAGSRPPLAGTCRGMALEGLEAYRPGRLVHIAVGRLADAVLGPLPLVRLLPHRIGRFVAVGVHRRLRTNNLLERLNREIKRRTRVATLFPNEDSLLRLATAVLIETDEQWQTEKRHLPLKTTKSTPTSVAFAETRLHYPVVYEFRDHSTDFGTVRLQAHPTSG